MAMLLTETISVGLVIAAAAVFLIVGWVAIYLVMRRQLEKETARLSHDMEAYAASLKRLMPETSAPSEARAESSVAAPATRVVTEDAEAEEEISPELVLVITAAVTAYLGKKVRIRSAKRLQTPYEIVNPWAQQGRVWVQASHDIAQRGH